MSRSKRSAASGRRRQELPWRAALIMIMFLAQASWARAQVFVEDPLFAVGSLGPSWCSEPAKLVARAKTQTPVDINAAPFRRLVAAATAQARVHCPQARALDLWLCWEDRIAPIGRAEVDTGWHWPPFRAPADFLRQAPGTDGRSSMRETRPRRISPPRPNNDKPRSGEGFITVLCCAWLVSVVVCLLGIASNAPTTKRIAYAVLNILLAFVPVLFGALVPTATAR